MTAGQGITADELRARKARWEASCQENEDDVDHEPELATSRVLDVGPRGEASFPLDLEEGQLLLLRIDAAAPVDVILAPEDDDGEGEHGDEAPVVLVKRARAAEVSFDARCDGGYTLSVRNPGRERARVEVGACVWPAVEEHGGPGPDG